MRALRPRQQRVVLALFRTRGNRTEANEARRVWQGFAQVSEIARLKFFMDDRVRAAVREVAEREIAICEPELLALTWTSLAMRAFLRATG
jgi:hypothetical protein